MEIAETALDSFSKQARGSLQAPNGDDNTRLFTAKGGSAVTLASGTTSAAIVYDPEASVRNGQMNVVVYGRNSADAVVEVQNVTLGRPTNEFLSVGVLSSSLKIFNSSGTDVIGGTQTAAILTSVPRDIAVISSTAVSNACPNHDRDMVGGVVSRDESTITTALTEHFGKKMALARTNTLSNLVKRSWDDGIDARRTTTGSNLTFIANTTMVADSDNDATLAEVLTETSGETLRAFVDTKRLSSANNPLTLATFAVDIEAQIELGDPGSNGTATMFQRATAYALDASNGLISSSEVARRSYMPDNAQSIVHFTATVTSSTVPIARVILAYTLTGGALDDLFISAGSTAKVTAYEETADISARPVHVCVLEGLNDQATININSAAVLTGVPDSTNVFISSAQQDDLPVYDTNAVEIFLKSVSRTMPRAFTMSGHSAVARQVHAMYGDEQVSIAFKAMSFGEVASGIKKLSKMAGMTAKQLAHAMEEAEPFMRAAGAGLSKLPGPAGMVGDAMMMGSDMSRRMR